MASSSSSPGLSTAALLAILACVATLLAVSALSLSLRRQKRDSLSPLEEDDVRENIITYDDEGGGEADTAAFDIAALQSAPHSSCRGYRTLDSRNIRYTQQVQDNAPGYRWTSKAGLESQYPSGAAPLYGRLCYSSHTLPALRHSRSVFETGLGLAELPCRYPAGPLDHSLVIQNQGAMSGAQDREADGKGGAGEGEPCATQQNRSQNLDWVQSESLPTDQTLVVTRSGLSAVTSKRLSGAWACDTGVLTGHRARHASPSPKQVGTGPPGTPDSLASTPSNGKDCSDGLSRSSGSILQGELHRDYPSSLGKGGLETGNSFVVARPPLEGSVPLGGTAPGILREGMGYIPNWRNMAGYVLGRRDMIPQLLPVPGQNRGMVGQMAYRGGWGTEVGVGGSSSLAVRVGEFLKLRLAQVTFDPGQPPYDSVQVYGLEGEGSQAGSLSSLESEEEEKEAEPDWGGALEAWGPPFQRLAELFREREREREEEREPEDEELGRKEEGERGQNAGGSRSEGH